MAMSGRVAYESFIHQMFVSPHDMYIIHLLLQLWQNHEIMSLMSATSRRSLGLQLGISSV